MIQEAELKSLLLEAFPKAEIEIFDKTGVQDHFALWVSHPAFAGKNRIQQHQLVYQALDGPMKEGRIHALEIKIDVPN